MEKSCLFAGCRKIQENKKIKLKAELYLLLTELINDGYIGFYTKGALGFDTIAALTVIRLKKSHPNIKLIFVYTCKGQTKGWNLRDIFIYEYIKLHCNKYVYKREKYASSDIPVDNNIYITYFPEECRENENWSNYSEQNGSKVINLAHLI